MPTHKYHAAIQLNQTELAAGQDMIERLFADMVAQSQVNNPLQNSVEGYEPTTDAAIRVDIELARVGVGTKKAHLFRVWMALQEHARTTGHNYVLKGDFAALVQSYGIVCSDRNLSRWLHKGHGLFWTIKTHVIELIGYKTVSKSLSSLARATGLRDLVATNYPGQRRYMYISIATDRLAEFEANVYAAWLASRNNPTIARMTLKRLFNRDLSVLREWEQLAGIQIIENFGHIPAEFSSDVPTNEQGELREDVHQYSVGGSTRYKTQLSNTYIVPTAIRQHPKRGQSRRVSREVREVLESDQPTGNCEQTNSRNTVVCGGLEPLGRRYFTDTPKATASEKAQAHATRHGMAVRYLAAGRIIRNQRQHIFAPDGVQRMSAVSCYPKHTGRVKNA